MQINKIASPLRINKDLSVLSGRKILTDASSPLKTVESVYAKNKFTNKDRI